MALRRVAADSREGAARLAPVVPSALEVAPVVRSDRTAAAQGAQDREDPPEEDREGVHPRLSRRAAVVKD